MMEVVDGESENALKLWSKEKLKFYDAATNEAWCNLRGRIEQKSAK